MEASFQQYVGIDWASKAHQVCVLDRERTVIAERSLKHSQRGLAELAAWLTDLAGGNPGSTAVAIELNRGAIVESLAQRGFAVFSINPKQLDRFRDRHTVAGAKDDRRDAFVLADSLRTDEPAFSKIELDGAEIVQLRELSRIQEDLKQERNRLANKLGDQLRRFWPDLLELCPGADERWFWRLLATTGTPQKARKVSRSKVELFLRKQGIRKVSPDDLFAALRTPPLPLAAGATEAATRHISLLVPRLLLVDEQLRECAAEIKEMLGQIEHRDVAVVRSQVGIGNTVAATMLSEARQALAQRDYQVLRCRAGTAPVTKQSGRDRRVAMRHACNKRLRNALFYWAGSAVRLDPRRRAQYQALRARGHSHGRALRTVADRLLFALVAMLRKGELYDPDQAPHNHVAAA